MAVSSPDTESSDDPYSNSAPSNALEAEHLSQNGKEYSVQITDPSQPNKTTHIISKTLSATFLRETRNETVKFLEGRDADEKNEVGSHNV